MEKIPKIQKQWLKSLLWLDDYITFFENTYGKVEDYVNHVDFLNQNEKELFPEMDLVISIAEPKDAPEIKRIIKETYKGTYPYKKIEDEKELSKLIESEAHTWFIFKVEDRVIGTLGYTFDFKNKKGKSYGLILKKEFHGKISIKNIVLICMIYIYKTYKGKILKYFGESRTKHHKGQVIGNNCGLKPIAFFPNKDNLLNEPESSFLHVIYDSILIEKYRTREIPQIIPEIVDFYLFSDMKYGLGRPIITDYNLNIDINAEKKILENLKIVKESKKFGIFVYKLFLENTNSYFRIEYDNINKNVENCTYRVNNIEELNCFLKEIVKIVVNLNVRYIEIFVSAYQPGDQKVFFENNFKPCGYIPSYFLNEKNGEFEDAVIFYWFKGEIKFLESAPENLEFLEETNFLSKLKEQI